MEFFCIKGKFYTKGIAHSIEEGFLSDFDFMYLIKIYKLRYLPVFKIL